MRKIDPERHEAQRRRIVEAAAACFARKGFHQTRTAEICAEAGMSAGNLFHYFPNKQAIVSAIVDEEARTTAEYLQAAGKAEDVVGEVLAFMDLVLDLAADPNFASLALEISAEAMRDDQIAEQVVRNGAAMQAAMRNLLVEAAARGQIDPTLDPSDAALWIFVLVDGVFARVSVDPMFRPADQAKMLRLLVSRFLKAELRP